MQWLCNKLLRLKAKKDDALAEVRENKALFEESVMSASASSATYDPKLVADILARFNQLEKDLSQAESQTQIEKLVQLSDSLAGNRAYVCPTNEIEIRGLSALHAMEEWGVPSSALESLKKDVVPRLSNLADLNAARGALSALFAECDSWSRYIDDYDEDMQNLAYRLSFLIGVTLLGAIFLISSGLVVWGLLLAGTCGAFVSVISKMPTLDVSGGNAAPYLRGVWRRVCMGLAASVIGSGFIVSGIITIDLPHVGTLPSIIEACAQLDCKTGNLLILVAFAMLFGFSERALTSFEEKVFQSK